MGVSSPVRSSVCGSTVSVAVASAFLLLRLLHWQMPLPLHPPRPELPVGYRPCLLLLQLIALLPVGKLGSRLLLLSRLALQPVRLVFLKSHHFGLL